MSGRKVPIKHTAKVITRCSPLTHDFRKPLAVCLEGQEHLTLVDSPGSPRGVNRLVQDFNVVAGPHDPSFLTFVSQRFPSNVSGRARSPDSERQEVLEVPDSAEEVSMRGFLSAGKPYVRRQFERGFGRPSPLELVLVGMGDSD